MNIRNFEPSRTFQVGAQQQIQIRHCADITLEADEQVTFVTTSGTEYDIVRKSWGYYATPSMNGRLRNHGLRAALVSNSKGHLFVMLCECGHETEFQKYLDDEQQCLLAWVDNDNNVCALTRRLQSLHQDD